MLSVSTGKINYDGFDTCRDSLEQDPIRCPQPFKRTPPYQLKCQTPALRIRSFRQLGQLHPIASDAWAELKPTVTTREVIVA